MKLEEARREDIFFLHWLLPASKELSQVELVEVVVGETRGRRER